MTELLDVVEEVDYLSEAADRIIEMHGACAHDWLVGFAYHIKALSARLRERETLVADVLAEYSDELDKAACDRCEDCGLVAMCRFHSVLSLLQRHSMTNAEIARRRMPLPSAPIDR